MLRYHMVVVTSDNALKRNIKRVTTATGSTADFVKDISGYNPKREPHLVIFDARVNLPSKKLLAKLPKKARLMHILKGDSLVDRLPLFKDSRSTSLLCYDERFDDDEFISSATKALRGDVFGLQKYFPWGVTTFSMLVKNHDEKGRAIDILMRYAQLAGVRGPVRDRIQLVCDELMMNALYHAPVDENGEELYKGKSPKELAQVEELGQVQVQYGCSGRYFGVSVRDTGGSLSRKRALEYLMRAKSGYHIESKKGGAGLGLISVLRSVSKLVMNLDHTYSTEVIGLFDMELFAKGSIGARSLHIFEAAPESEDDDSQEKEEEEEEQGSANNNAKWAVAAVLLAVLTAMGTAYYFKKVAPASAEAKTTPPSLTITVQPAAGVAITMNKRPLRADVATLLPADGTDIQLRVVAKGKKPWTRTIKRADIKRDRHIFVDLRRGR